jgi:hypothetical protein
MMAVIQLLGFSFFLTPEKKGKNTKTSRILPVVLKLCET